MDLELDGKTALVTGASSGIGRAVAKALAREGALVAAAARGMDLLETLGDEIQQEGGARPRLLTADLREDGAAAMLAQRARQALGHVDILINSAGGSRPVALDATQEQWSEGMVLNFFRVRELTHGAISDMIARGWGRVINITGTSEPRGLNAANSAKAAVHAWAKGLSREVARKGVTVNSLQPGYIISEQMIRLYPDEALRREVAMRDIPVGRFGDARELADLAVFLASPRAGYITGTAIYVDGGMSRFAF
jgi:3-oxoacyl-[acyl-carrier protein] reductase